DGRRHKPQPAVVDGQIQVGRNLAQNILILRSRIERELLSTGLARGDGERRAGKTTDVFVGVLWTLALGETVGQIRRWNPRRQEVVLAERHPAAVIVVVGNTVVDVIEGDLHVGIIIRGGRETQEGAGTDTAHVTWVGKVVAVDLAKQVRLPGIGSSILHFVADVYQIAATFEREAFVDHHAGGVGMG